MSTSSHSKTRKTSSSSSSHGGRGVAVIPNSDHRFSNGLAPAPTYISEGEDHDDDDDERYAMQLQHNNNNNSARVSRSGRKSSRTTVLDDDDFSVAPSMDQDVKSHVSVGFDDVYKRGRKVKQERERHELC
jgi:hypothetical protein